MQGIIIVNKERGFTSFDVVAKLRGILKTKKIGHTGTLDPEAVGVLVVCVGRATKLVDTLISHDKVYEAKLLLGQTTDTYDIWGETISESPVDVTEDEIRDVMSSFVGDILQAPPMYSAKKVDGKKLYELARQGKTVERKKVNVTVFGIDITDISIPSVSFTVNCSKGTYIRSLCHDIGEKLGCGGCMSALKRTKTGDFDISMAHTLDEIEALVRAGTTSEVLIPVDEVLGYKKIHVKSNAASLLENGGFLLDDDVEEVNDFSVEEPLLAYHPDGRFAATYIRKRNGYKLDKYFLE